MMAWFRRKNEIDDAINAGQLDRAMELTHVVLVRARLRESIVDS